MEPGAARKFTSGTVPSQTERMTMAFVARARASRRTGSPAPSSPKRSR